MIASDGDEEFEFEPIASLRRWREQITVPVAELQRQLAAPVAEMVRQMVPVAELQRQLAAPVAEMVRQMVPVAELQRELAESVALLLAQRPHWRLVEVSSQSNRPDAFDGVDVVWLVRICAFVLLAEILFIGWSIAAAAGPDTRARYVESIGLMMAALQISCMIKGK
jgi:hypothetical protein